MGTQIPCISRFWFLAHFLTVKKDCVQWVRTLPNNKKD